MYMTRETTQESVLEKVAIMPTEEVIHDEENGESLEIDSRFGKVTVNLEKSIFFPKGLFGIPGEMHFCLTDFPADRNMGDFKILQCVNDHSLSFIVLPLGVDNPLHEKDDLLECCEVAGVNPDNLLTLLIISVNKLPNSVKITANVRAPVLIDVGTKLAGQYIFTNNKYDISHVLSGGEG